MVLTFAGEGVENQNPHPFGKLRASSVAQTATRVGHPRVESWASPRRARQWPGFCVQNRVSDFWLLDISSPIAVRAASPGYSTLPLALLTFP